MNWRLQQSDFHSRWLYYVINLTDITNHAYNEAKLTVPATSLQACLTVYGWNLNLTNSPRFSILTYTYHAFPLTIITDMFYH